MAIEDFYISATLKSLSGSSSNDQYEHTKTYTDIPINCYIGSRTPIEVNVLGKFTTKVQYNCYMDYECKYGDLILYNNEYYRVISNPQNTVNLNHHYKLLVENHENINN